jgi:SAM-dependent methyltransferase
LDFLCASVVKSPPAIPIAAKTRIRNFGINRERRLFVSAVATLHNRLVLNRRAAVLSSWFAKLAPTGARILDVGCGDGSLAAMLLSKRPDLQIRGLDVLPRDKTHIPVEIFDGSTIPFSDASFDAILFADVLHHTLDPKVLLREARRVSARWLLMKDHFREGFAANLRLRMMDWVGNARFGVALPYNYWSEKQWKVTWQDVGWSSEELITRLDLYPAPADWVFGARLHFMARLGKIS